MSLSNILLLFYIHLIYKISKCKYKISTFSYYPCLIFSNETVQMFFCVSHIQYKTSKEGSTMGITVSHSAMLTHCHALTQACGYTEGEVDTLNLLLKYYTSLTYTYIHCSFSFMTWRKASSRCWKENDRYRPPALIIMLQNNYIH